MKTVVSTVATTWQQISDELKRGIGVYLDAYRAHLLEGSPSGNGQDLTAELILLDFKSTLDEYVRELIGEKHFDNCSCEKCEYIDTLLAQHERNMNK